MEDLEPKIYRQRLIIEAKYKVDISKKMINSFLIDFAKLIKMTSLQEPFIFSPNKTNHPIHHGIAGFIPWAESGCAIYTWDKLKFLSVEIYTCKNFDVSKAVNFVKEYFHCKKIVFQELTHGKNNKRNS